MRLASLRRGNRPRGAQSSKRPSRLVTQRATSSTLRAPRCTRRARSAPRAAASRRGDGSGDARAREGARSYGDAAAALLHQAGEECAGLSDIYWAASFSKKARDAARRRRARRGARARRRGRRRRRCGAPRRGTSRHAARARALATQLVDPGAPTSPHGTGAPRASCTARRARARARARARSTTAIGARRRPCAH